MRCWKGEQVWKGGRALRLGLTGREQQVLRNAKSSDWRAAKGLGGSLKGLAKDTGSCINSGDSVSLWYLHGGKIQTVFFYGSSSCYWASSFITLTVALCFVLVLKFIVEVVGGCPQNQLNLYILLSYIQCLLLFKRRKVTNLQQLSHVEVVMQVETSLNSTSLDNE